MSPINKKGIVIYYRNKFIREYIIRVDYSAKTIITSNNTNRITDCKYFNVFIDRLLKYYIELTEEETFLWKL